jgi:excisionase family DNA binding protein
MLSEAEAASMLKISVDTLQRMRGQGRGIAFAKIGGVVRYSPADVDLYIRNHEHQFEKKDSRSEESSVKREKS